MGAMDNGRVRRRAQVLDIARRPSSSYQERKYANSLVSQHPSAGPEKYFPDRVNVI